MNMNIKVLKTLLEEFLEHKDPSTLQTLFQSLLGKKDWQGEDIPTQYESTKLLSQQSMMVKRDHFEGCTVELKSPLGGDPILEPEEQVLTYIEDNSNHQKTLISSIKYDKISKNSSQLNLEEDFDGVYRTS